MPQKAAVAFRVMLGLALLAIAVPAWCFDTGASGPAIGRPVDLTPKITEAQSIQPPAALPTLTLDDALTRTLKQSPRLSAFAREVEARAFEVRQAALRPNPELSIEVENVAGNGDFSGTDRAETTVRVSQTLELGGKRAARHELGRLDREVAQREYDIARIEVLSKTTDRFVAVLAAQQKLLLATEQVALTEKVVQTVEARIAAGKTATIEKVRFQTLVAEARLRQEQARQALTAARLALAGAWGSETVDFATVQGSFETVRSVPDWSQLTSGLDHSPQAALQASATRRAERTLEMERANSVPDLTLSLGAKDDRDSGNHALVAELSIPLPLFDRNQDAVAAARTRMAQAEDEARSARLRLRAKLAEGWQRLQAAHSEADVLRREILPATRQIFDGIAYGYQAGKYNFLEVLDAERTLFEAKSRYVDALATYHRAVSALDRLLGRDIFADGELSPFGEKERGQS